MIVKGDDFLAFFGFFDYTSSGKGIAKDAPVKRPFFKFWEIFGAKFWKLLHVNLIYFLFCLPVITIGPATVALTHVIRKFILEQPIFVFDEFLEAFKKNFKQGLFIGIVDIIFIIAFVVSAIYRFQHMNHDTSFMNVMLTSITLASGAFIWMMHFYIYPQIAALTLSMNQIIKNSFYLTILGIKRNVFTLIISAVMVAAMVITIELSIFLLPILPAAWISFITVFISYPVIQKFIINPYYESRGEKNPEIPDYSHNESDDGPLFEDFGGRESEYKATKKAKTASISKPKGKVIK